MFRKKKEDASQKPEEEPKEPPKPIWIKASCPVCKSDLDYRQTTRPYEVPCNECQHNVRWIPGDEKPIMTPFPKKDKGCGCKSCGR